MIRARLKKKERPSSVAAEPTMAQQGVNQPFRDIPNPVATSPGGYGSGSPSNYGNNNSVVRNRGSFDANFSNGYDASPNTFGGSAGYSGSPAGLAGYTGRGTGGPPPPIPAKVPLGNEVAYGRNVYDRPSEQGHTPQGQGDMSALSRELNSIDIGSGGGRGRVAGRRMLGFR
jgi:hypothetical protein